MQAEQYLIHHVEYKESFFILASAIIAVKMDFCFS